MVWPVMLSAFVIFTELFTASLFFSALSYLSLICYLSPLPLDIPPSRKTCALARVALHCRTCKERTSFVVDH